MYFCSERVKISGAYCSMPKRMNIFVFCNLCFCFIYQSMLYLVSGLLLDLTFKVMFCTNVLLFFFTIFHRSHVHRSILVACSCSLSLALCSGFSYSCRITISSKYKINVMLLTIV